jgi:hypothetical protein
MTELPKSKKPYRFETITKPVTAKDYTIWESTLWDYLYDVEQYRRFLETNLTWTTDKEDNRGFRADEDGPVDQRLTGKEKAAILDSILLKIGRYGPKYVFIDITRTLTSYKNIFAAIKRVCGFPVAKAQLVQYVSTKNAFNRVETETYNDLYYRLRDEKIASLKTKNSGANFRGSTIKEEVITTNMENQVVIDWLEAIGGAKLVKYIGQEYTEDLKKNSIFDLQEILGSQEIMETILEDMELKKK